MRSNGTSTITAVAPATDEMPIAPSSHPAVSRRVLTVETAFQHDRGHFSVLVLVQLESAARLHVVVDKHQQRAQLSMPNCILVNEG